MLAVNQEHAFPGREEHAGRDLQARVNVHGRVNAIGLFLAMDFLVEGHLLALFGGFGLGGGVPIDQGRGNLFPVAALDAVVAHAVAVALVAAHDLKGAILQHEFLAARQGVLVLLGGAVSARRGLVLLGAFGSRAGLRLAWADRLAVSGHKGYTQELADRKSTRLNSSHVSISYAVF